MNAEELRQHKRQARAAELARHESIIEAQRLVTRRHEDRARVLLGGELGEYLKRHVDENHMALEAYRSWEWDGKETGREHYGEKFQLGIPIESPVIDLLIEILRAAGYTAWLYKKQVANYRFVTTADGYDIRDEPGTHEVRYLIIDWSAS